MLRGTRRRGSFGPVEPVGPARLVGWLARGGVAGLLLLCGAASATRAHEALRVSAAASLREPMLEIARRFEERDGGAVHVAFGASSALLAQIRAGAPADVFVSADDRLVDELVRSGRVPRADTATLAGNRLVLVARSPVPASDSADPARLLRGARRVALPAAHVPLGRYARAWLERRGLQEELADRTVLVEHARAALAAVDLGHADLAIVYATDARVARRARTLDAIPDEEQPAIRYAAARLAPSERARRFLAYLVGPEAQGVLRAAGFAPAPPAGGTAASAGGEPP